MTAAGINIQGLEETDVGRWVRYCPAVGPRQTGWIKSWNHKWIFVVYCYDENFDRYQELTAEATDPADLEFIHD